MRSVMSCTCTHVSCEWVFCVHPPSVVGKFISRSTKTNVHKWSDLQEFPLLVVEWLLSQFVNEDDGDESDRFLRAAL